LRTPALANNQKKVEKENEFTGKRYKNQKNNNILIPKHKLSRDQGGAVRPFSYATARDEFLMVAGPLLVSLKRLQRRFAFTLMSKIK